MWFESDALCVPAVRSGGVSAPWRFGGLAPSRICTELWQRALLAPRFSFRGLCGPDTCLGGLSASPARRASQIQKHFPNGGRERHALPMERLFASKGPQRAGAPFVDFPYALVGIPPIFGAPAGSSHCLPCPLLRRAARDGCARVRPQDGVSQCRLYIIMYSWAVESEAPWKTIPRHTCRTPFCRS